MTQFLILYALFALATPIFVIVLYVRYSNLRARLARAEEETAKQAAALRHEIADLRKQVTALKVPVSPAPLAEEHRPVPAAATHETPTPPPTPQPHPVVPPPSVVAPPPLPHTTPTTPQEPKKIELPPSVPIPPPATHPAPPTHTEEPPVPPAPVHPAPQPPTRPTAPAPTKPEIPLVPPPKTPAHEVPAAARVSAPPAYSPLRIATAKPSLQDRLKKVSAFEEALGTNWLQKLGIVLLVLGVASFGIYELAALGSFGKVMVLYLAAAVLLAGGIYLERNERYQLLGRTGIGGGWALFFFTTFAMYYVPAMHVLHSAVLDSILMLLVAVVMAAHTLRYRSQLVTGLAFLLGYSTVALSQDTVYSLSAGVILAIGLVVIVLRMRWYQLEVFGILSGYLNHLYWLYRILGIEGARGRHFPEYTASTAMLFFYWLVFRISYLWRKPDTPQEEHTSTIAAILNSTLLLAAMRFQSVHPELAYIALLAVGAVELAFGQIVKHRREAFVVLSVVGATLLLAAAPAHYAGPDNDVAILWLVGAEVFLLAGVLVKEVVFRRIGLVTGTLVAAWLAYFDLRSLLATRSASETALVWAATLFGTCALAFYLNALGIGRKWQEFFEPSPDGELLTVHSYLGALCGAAAAWACFTHDWTAVAFAGVMLLLAALARSFASQHLQLQYLFFGALVVGRAYAVNLHLASSNGIHVTQRLITLPLLAAAFYGTARLAALKDTIEQRFLRGLFAAAGSLTLGSLIWLESPELWRPVALIAFAIALAEAGRALRYPALAWHTHVACFFAATTVVAADPHHLHHWHELPVRALSGLAVIAGFYWLAWRGTKEGDLHLPVTRTAYTWASAALMLWALFDMLHAPWIAVGWIAFAVALTLAARWMKYEQLAWQANIVAFCATFRAVDANYDLTQTLWPGISLRVITISLVAAGLYFVSRKASPHEDARRITTFVHSFCATGMLAALMFYEAPNGWLAPLWAAFALALALVDRKWNSDELPWQAHILSLLAFARAFIFNLQSDATWHHWSVRLLSVALVAVIFYAMATVIRLPEQWKEKALHHGYSWAASILASMVLWHELKPLPVAVAWAAFGLILFEYGLLRRISQFRYQAYVALIAAFTRIFFVNLTAGQPGEFWSQRLYTILPLVAIFFLVYAQLLGESGQDSPSGRDRDWHLDVIIGSLGTAAAAALLRYQFPGEWVVTAWATLVLLLFAVAYFLRRNLFLYQGLAMTALTFSRGVSHNLFGSSYFTEGDWKGRYVVVGAAVALLLASLAFAFPLRQRAFGPGSETVTRRVLSAVARRPEQLQFFASVILLWLMLTLKMNAGMKTVAWGIEGVAIIVLALLVKERSFRLTGLGLLLLCVAKIMALDVWGLQARDRYITLMIIGAALMLVSYLYSRYRETIRQFL